MKNEELIEALMIIIEKEVDIMLLKLHFGDTYAQWKKKKLFRLSQFPMSEEEFNLVHKAVEWYEKVGARR